MLDLDTAPVVEISISSIDVGPRLRKSPVVRSSFVESIAKRGLIHPILVRIGADGRFWLIVGQCRLEAMKRLGRSTIPARVITIDPVRALDLERDENIERVPLSELEMSVKRREWCLREYAVARASDQAPPPRKFGPKPKGGSDGALAEVSGVASQTVTRDRLHVEAVDRYAFLAAVGKVAAIQLRRLLDGLDPEARESLAVMIGAEVREADGIAGAVERVARMTLEGQRECARMYWSGDKDERAAALALLVMPVPEPEPPSPPPAERSSSSDPCGDAIRAGLQAYRVALASFADAVALAPVESQMVLREKFRATRSFLSNDQSDWLRLAGEPATE
jgi:hypothetical protein